MKRSARKGQAVLEYVILIALLVMVILYGINSVLSPRLHTTMDNAGAAVDTANAKFHQAFQ